MSPNARPMPMPTNQSAECAIVTVFYVMEMVALNVQQLFIMIQGRISMELFTIFATLLVPLHFHILSIPLAANVPLIVEYAILLTALNVTQDGWVLGRTA